MADPENVEFGWDEANVAHRARHRVAPEEAEQVLYSNPVVVVFTVRLQRIRVVTAYRASGQMQRVHLGRKGSTS